MKVQRIKSDTEVQHDVLRELMWDSRVAATDVGVEVDGGVVTLTGTVSSYAKKLAAREAAHNVAGVLDVADDVEVVIPNSGRPRDTDIAAAVRSGLKWSAFVSEQQIQTTVADGWVTLEGEVERWTERVDAEAAVHNLRGVHGVTNQLQIKAPPADDETVCTAIEAALERRVERESKDIRVHVESGTVTLSGSVHDWSEQSAIIDAAAHAPGVQTVKNELRIDLFER